MASELLCGLIFRLLLPVCLAATCLFRYSGLSLVYLIYLLLIPLFSEPSRTTMQGRTGSLLKSLCVTSLSFLLMQITYQVTISSLLANGRMEPSFNCSAWEKSLRQLGLESVQGADAGNGIRVFIPDIGMLVAGLVTWLLCLRLEDKPQGMDTLLNHNNERDTQENVEEEEDEGKDELEDELLFEDDSELEEDGGMSEEEEEEEEESTKRMILRQIASMASKLREIIGNLITTAGKVMVTILLGLTGIMLPSLTSAVYFLVFLGLCTWWSLCLTFDPLVFSCLCVLMAIFSAGHLLVLYIYQLQVVQELIPPGDPYASVFGVVAVVQTDCSAPWALRLRPGLAWHHYTNPLLVLVLYYTLATLIRLWLHDPPMSGDRQGIEREETGCDINNDITSDIPIDIMPSAEKRREQWRTYHMDERNVLIGTTFGSPLNYPPCPPTPYPTPPNLNTSSLDLYSESRYEAGQGERQVGGSMYEVVRGPGSRPASETEVLHVSLAVTAFRFIMKQSYICALIAMMAWSITYVSWLTFVLLLWSCVLWMVRDRRRYAILSSPFMVVYGTLLLLLQYIWSFELMQPLPGLFLKREVPFRELASKILCLLSFWLLLRQSLTERKASQKEEGLSDIKIEAHRKEEEEQAGGQREVMALLGSTVIRMFVKYWIYVCGGMFFFVSFEGRIVMYKIIYMMLFLFCVALYQVHYEWWRRVLKYFWMSVVVYTMLVLILVYTFQFPSSLQAWARLTGMSKDRLEDLGLERFSVPALFTRIFVPASFLLVCVLHLHYFHDDFLSLTDIKTVLDKQSSTITRLVHLDGSLADISLAKPPIHLPQTEEDQGGEQEMAENEKHMEKEEKKEWMEKKRDMVPGQPESKPCSVDQETPPEDDTDLRRKWRLVGDRLSVLLLQFLQYVQRLQLLVWWLLELHIIKIVSAYIIWVSVKEVSLFNSVFVVSWAFSLPFSQFRPLASSVCTVWTCIIIICKMLYQLSSIQPYTYYRNCSMPGNYSNAQREELSASLLYNAPIDPAHWVGLRKATPLLDNLKNNLVMLALLVFEITVYRHQMLHRLQHKLTPPTTRTIFHDITRQHLDDGIMNCAKYFVNYFFYKFGVETCFLLAVNVIGQRMDFYAMLHAFGLIAIISHRHRKSIAQAWPCYCCFLSCLLTLQYLLCIGVPPAACKDYPWRFPSSNMDSNVIKWLYIPDYHTRPNPFFLLYDFMLLLSVSLQREVFKEENQVAVHLLAGDNVEICNDLDAASFSQHNPAPDFIHCRSYLDMLKVIIFSYLFWFVLTIIFITGTTRISIFCMGYLVACFYLLLFGGELLLKPINSILHYWDFLIAYNVFVITMKNILSVLACGYIKALVVNHCWLIQLFSLACTIKGYSKPEQQANKQCELPSDEAGIIWDSICFAFLLLQRRVFMSYYFLHVVADIRSAQILASRGAELFHATIVKAVRARLEVEKKSMDLLKRQMDRIKSRQKRFKRGKERMLTLVQESTETHQDPPRLQQEQGQTEREKKGGRRKEWWRPWVDHASMVRSGNYYLFESDSEEEEEEEEEKKEEKQPKKSAFQFVYHAWITDSKTAMKERSQEKQRFWQRYTEGPKSRREETRKEEAGREDTEEGCAAVELEDEEAEEKEGKTDGPDNILKRLFNMLKFSWVLVQALLDSLTAWLNSLCQEHISISTVLRIERCMLTHEVKKGNLPSRESIHLYYQQQMCCGASVESGLEKHPEDFIFQDSEWRRSAYQQESQDSVVSRDSLSSTHTDATLMYLYQSNLDRTELGERPHVLRTSQRPRPMLQKMAGMDLPSSFTFSTSSSLESVDSRTVSEHTKPTALCAGQGTLKKMAVDPPCLTDPPSQPAPSPGGISEGAAWEQGGRCPSCSGSTELQLDSAQSLRQSPREVDIPPSYSLALGLDLQEGGTEVAGGVPRTKRRLVMAPEEREEPDTLPSLTHELTASELLSNRMFYDEELEASERFFGDQPALLLLCYALYNTLVARSEMVCYLVIILNHMVSASCATLVLPILIFLWAMLSVPRPSKRFWMTAIVYTEVTIVIKYFFQFGFFPFNQNMELDRTKPFHPPNIIGVEKKEGYVHYDLIQLLALFFHRSILKCHGLWDEDDSRRGVANVTIARPAKRRHSNSEKKGRSKAREEKHPPASPSSQETVLRRFSKQSHSTSMPLCRKSSISQRSAHSRGSVSSRGSLRKGGSMGCIQQRSKKEMILEKLQEQLIRAKSFTVNGTLQFYVPIRQFFYSLIHPEYSAVTDVYVLMFLADTVDFIIIVFGFWAFGKHSAAADITSSLSEDQVPEAFLVMVLIQFGTMVVDRALYLRKTVMGKVIFQVILVFGIHFWMFFILPGVTERRFSQNTVAQLWYFVKCIYFGLSAYQIRCGYPTRVLGNFLTKSYNYLNLFLFQGFRLVPFLTELRAVMDWVWTDTTLSLSSWICVEDIYAHIFVLKCWRESEKRYPQPRGQKKKVVVKYGMGGMIVLLLICIVWFPLLFMSLVKSVAGVVNKPLDVSVTITLGGFQPIFTMSAQQNQLKDVSAADFSDFMNSYNYIPSAMQFLEAYTSEDLTVAELEGSSNSLWTISPPSRNNLMDVLSYEEQFPVTMSWTIQRNLSLGAKAEVATDKHVTYLDMTTRQELIDLLNGTRSQAVVIEQVFPCFIRAPSDSNAKPIEQLYKEEGYKNILLALERTTNGSGEIQEWWIVDQPAASKIKMRGGASGGKRGAGLQLYVFSDKVSPPSLGFLAGYGIMGLYASVVLVIGKFVREFFSGISHSIMFEELQCVDRILKLCTDIFLVRETGELELEEELYAKLIFLYRSPETMIKWTREKNK
ncbi:piezo-type mechanosensitive ion channel component 2-like isoform X1 [Hypomesus transpacificus]|uniref:piezo-type mechanosensitive ion channel component 2-like isoform X1 n=1 Tax=Hypomesus transpacificus TaxID=137520 RepID=UPI001F077590|nr:piezo-type mechanosensitive ion channel component 2-like isoform X1 [Hypomesus transpacificus]